MKRWALVVTMLDEVQSVLLTLQRVGKEFACIRVVQSGEEPYAEVEAALSGHRDARYFCLPDLDTRTDEEKQGKGERFDIGARAQSRNYSHGFQSVEEAMAGGCKVSYLVGIHGDTATIHRFGIEWIIQKMSLHTANVGVSRAMGQSLHAASLTREQMTDPDHPKGGRIQDDTNKDFMPQFFVAKSSMCGRLAHIDVTNPWCMEQCMGDAIGDANMFVFSKTAYGFADGIVYHCLSPKGWKH